MMKTESDERQRGRRAATHDAPEDVVAKRVEAAERVERPDDCMISESARHARTAVAVGVEEGAVLLEHALVGVARRPIVLGRAVGLVD